MHYDLNGNMRSFERYNGDEILKYKYLLDGNQLVRVKRYPGTKDSEGKVAFGIEEADNPFEYDAMGNLVYDGQNQLKISYDFLNLPEKIAPAELHSQAGKLFLANYCYLWNGEKVASTDVRGNGYLYIGSVRYSLDSAKPAFESAPFAMGRIGRLGEEYDTRYFLNDHLESVRAIVNQNGVVTAEYDYMPYGMQHKNSSLATSDTNEFRYNGKELQSRFCVDLYDSQARLQGMNARFNSIDPLAGEMPDISPYAYCAGNPIKNIDPDGLAWRPTYDEDHDGNRTYNGYEWIDAAESYNESGTLKAGLYAQAIFFSDNGTFDASSDYNMGSSTATVYLADGTTTTFDANTSPSSEDYATIPEGIYHATVGTHYGSKNSYTALKMRDEKAASQTIELDAANPAHPERTYAEGINIHKPGRNNLTGMTSAGTAISQGCLLIDRNSWSDFIGNFDTDTQRTNTISVTVSRSLATPVNATRLPAFNFFMSGTRRSFFGNN